MRSKSAVDIYEDKFELKAMLAILHQDGSVENWGVRMKRGEDSMFWFTTRLGKRASNMQVEEEQIEELPRQVSGLQETVERSHAPDMSGCMRIQ